MRALLENLKAQIIALDGSIVETIKDSRVIYRIDGLTFARALLPIWPKPHVKSEIRLNHAPKDSAIAEQRKTMKEDTFKVVIRLSEEKDIPEAIELIKRAYQASL